MYDSYCLKYSHSRIESTADALYGPEPPQVFAYFNNRSIYPFHATYQFNACNKTIELNTRSTP